MADAQREYGMSLYETILKLKTPEECVKFFQDLCSVNELRSIEQRFEVARLLAEGQVYTNIAQKTGAGSATISRVNRTLNYGEGMLLELLNRK